MAINKQSSDIADFIKKKLSKRFNEKYQNKFITKINEKFIETEFNLFIIKSYNYDQKKDFTINLDDVWNMLGFSTKNNCKMILDNNFEKDNDYIIKNNDDIIKNNDDIIKNNDDIILMNIDTFLILCAKSSTKEGDILYNNLVKLEQIYYNLIIEENKELKEQLKIIDIKLNNLKIKI